MKAAAPGEVWTDFSFTLRSSAKTSILPLRFNTQTSEIKRKVIPRVRQRVAEKKSNFGQYWVEQSLDLRTRWSWSSTTALGRADLIQGAQEIKIAQRQ